MALNARHALPACRDRRGFLRLSATAGAAVFLRPAAIKAAGRSLPPLEFSVVSDTHLGYRDQPAAARNWQQAAAQLARQPGRFVLHLGDLVDRGREAQYPLYLAAKRRIGKPVHEVPGNHDPVELFTRYVRPQVETAVTYDWLRLVLMNNSRTDSHNGFLTAGQLDWLQQQLRRTRQENRWALLAMHVPAHKNLHPDRGWYVHPEHGQRRLYRLLAEYRDRVLAIFHGHFHNGIRGWNDHAPLHEVVFPSLLYNGDRKLMQQGAPGYNLPEFRPGWVQVRIARGTMQLQYRPLRGESPASKRLPLEPLSSRG